MTKYLSLTTSLLLVLGISTSVQAIPLDKIVDGEVVRVDYSGTCDEAYADPDIEVYACVTLQTIDATPSNNGSGGDCTGPRCVKVKKPWEVGGSLVRTAGKRKTPTAIRPNVQKRDVVICNSSRTCYGVDKCNESGTRYQKGDSGWRDVPLGWVCDDSVLRLITPATKPLDTSSAQK